MSKYVQRDPLFDNIEIKFYNLELIFSLYDSGLIFAAPGNILQTDLQTSS